MPPDLRDRYRLGDRLGSGGMADVHRATDTTLQREVAVKVLRDTAGEESDRARFVAEARTLASLSHRNLVTVLDAGIGDQDDRPFLVMELVEGRTLSAALRDGPLPPTEVARTGAAVAAGLDYAHGRGVVHRDVKPANVLLGEGDRVKLADFGIARLIGDTVRHTRTGTAIGTAAYLAPEQVRGESVSGAVDVYSLGLVLLEALTGERAFPGTATEAALARLHRDPALPDDLPGGWAPLLAAMTAADPAARPSAGEVQRVCAAVGHDGVLPPTTPVQGVWAAAPEQPRDDLPPTAVLTAPAATAVVPLAGAAGAAGAGAAGAGAVGATAGAGTSPATASAGPGAHPVSPAGTPDPSAPGTGPLGVRPAVPALDRAGDAMARVPGRVAARWRGLEPHQRGLAGALAALVLLILVTALAAGATPGSDSGSPTDPAATTPAERGGPGDDTGTDPAGGSEEPEEPTLEPLVPEGLPGGDGDGPGRSDDRGPAGGPPGKRGR